MELGMPLAGFAEQGNVHIKKSLYLYIIGECDPNTNCQSLREAEPD